MSKYYIGIDLATRNIGFVLYKEGVGVVKTQLTKLSRFNAKNLEQNNLDLKEGFANFLLGYTKDFKDWDWSLSELEGVFVELSNYSNKTSLMFGFLASTLYNWFIEHYDDWSEGGVFSNFKFIEPREWQALMLEEMGIKTIYKQRETWKKKKCIKTPEKWYTHPNGDEIRASQLNIKKLSRQFFETKAGYAEENDDITDAFALAYFGKHCKGIW